MNNGVSILKEGISLNGINGADELYRSIVDVRFDKVIEVLLVLNYAGDYEVHAGFFCHVNCQMCTLIHVYAAVMDELVAGIFSESEVGKVDAVIDRSKIRQAGVPVGIAYGDVVRVLMVVVNAKDIGVGKAVDCGEHRCFYKRQIGQGQVIKIIVNQVKFIRPLHYLRNMQAGGDQRDTFLILLVTCFNKTYEFCFCDGFFRGEKCYIFPSTGDEALRDVACYRFPGTIGARRGAPGYRG